MANSGSTLTAIGYDARNGTVTSVAPVTLRDRSQITGNVVSSGAITPGTNVVVSGTQTPNTPLTFDRWSWSVSLPASGGPVSVPVNGSSSIAPGSYAGVQAFSGATLSLRAGTYFMDALTMEPQSRLAVDTRNGNVIIYMRTGFTFRGSTVFTGPNDRLLFVYLGTTQPGIDRSFDCDAGGPERVGAPRRRRVAVRGRRLRKVGRADPDVATRRARSPGLE